MATTCSGVAEEAKEIGGVCLDEVIVDRGVGEKAEEAELASGRDDAEDLAKGIADNKIELGTSSGSLSLLHAESSKS